MRVTANPNVNHETSKPARRADRAGVLIPELLAPAGDWDCVRAAVENGADAVYFGLEQFNARMRAGNFTETDLPELMAFLHRRGVKGYVTFNTLVFTPELPTAVDYLRTIIASGVDAAIVQDVGICRLIRALSPDFPIHASTQMTVTSEAGVRFARDLGANLVVLARECSIAEIRQIRQSLLAGERSDASAAPLPLEVFVHGALCVAYSGQCLTSEALGGRSANRGECAQACRMPYELVSDGNTVELGDRRYLLSPQDLAGISVLPELIEAGVRSLKIEGRLKSPEYVASVTRTYREALDLLAADTADQTEGPASHTSGGSADASDSFSAMVDRSRYDLEMAFSRGLYTGWLGGINNQALAHAQFAKKRGVLVGTVTGLDSGRLRVRGEAPIKAGDGVVIDSGRPDVEEFGGRIYSVTEDRGQIVLTFANRQESALGRVRPGDRVWKTSDPELDRRIRATYEVDRPRFRRPLRFEAHGFAGAPLTLIATDDSGNAVRLDSKQPLAPASNQPLDDARLGAQLGRLGGSVFEFESLKNCLEGSVILPVSELNRLRREAVRELEALRSRPRQWTLSAASSEQLVSDATRGPSVTGYDSAPSAHEDPGAPGEIQLIVLVRSIAQLESVLLENLTTIYCEFDDPRRYREAVRLVRERPGAEVFVAPPRIHKTGEDWILDIVRSSEPDGFLIRNYDQLEAFSGRRCIGDFSLNIANPVAAHHFKTRYSLERLTASYDLNADELEALLRASSPDWFEVTLHQHMPMFHMEHCVFCAFLSTGTDYTNCGRPCDKHEVRLRDRVGQEHVLKADAGCRNTVFNARAQTGAEHFSQLAARFRVDNQFLGRIAACPD